MEPSHAILTAPNVITFCRLLMIAPFLWLSIGLRRDGPAWILGLVLGNTDWVDGMVARRFNQVSRLGIALDPLVDRLVIVAFAAMCVVRQIVPLWAIGVIVARELLLLAAVPLLLAKGVERPAVTLTGKLGFFTLMWAFGAFYAAEIPDPPSVLLRWVAWTLYTGGVTLGYAAAAGYMRTALDTRKA